MVTIRKYRETDLGALYAINQASTPGVGSEDSAAGLKRWIDLSDCFVAVGDDDAPLGFITLIAAGTLAYTSANLRWCEDNCEDFVYVDRIAVAASARGDGIGERLYAAAFEAFAGQVSQMTCEVNRLPPNPGSQRFHERLGFRIIGERAFDEGRKAVIYYGRQLQHSHTATCTFRLGGVFNATDQ